MTIYQDKISESLGLLPITFYFPDFKEDDSIPEGSTIGSFGFLGPHSEETKKMMSESRKGEKNSFYGKKHEDTKICASFGMLGKRHTEETKKKISVSSIGKPGTNNGKKFGPRSEEQKKRISEATKKAMADLPKRVNKKVCCPYCNKIGAGSNMTRYHFNNCKLKND